MMLCVLTPVKSLARRVGPFDATMIVMGGIVGSGIFVTPATVARSVGSAALIVTAWLVGGAVAVLGAFIYAELAARRPEVGGQYVYLRDAYHPLAAFLYGWVLLLVIQTGGMAASAVTFARYALELAPLPVHEGVLAMAALAVLTAVNCLGVGHGTRLQSVLMVAKIVAVLALVGCGLLLGGHATARAPTVATPSSPLLLVGALASALVPVLFSYGGWQTAGFVAGEMRAPARDLPRALLAGVSAVIVLYVLVAFACVRVLGPAELARTTTPALDVMRRALGARGAALLAVGISLSTLGFLSQSILTAPRVYFAMAEDRLFFARVGWLHPRTRVPVFAIVLQGVLAGVIALWGRYDGILRYVVSMDFLFFGLTALTLFVFRRREPAAPGFRVPGHPVTTLLFVLVCWGVVLATFIEHPENSAIGLGLLLVGVPVFAFWRRRRRLA